ncbi:MAG: prolyl oligopeptidase family serine peptidase [Gemmatimonadales bacterium]|jgi:dipeptidyl aminopeptidase/acylaminoacyl peptidase
MRGLRVFIALAALAALLPATSARGQTPAQQAVEMAERLVRAHDRLDHRLDVLEKLIDDVLWFERLGDVAVVEKVRIYGPPLANEPNPPPSGPGNPFKFYTYVFTPREDFGGRELPLLVLPHGGVHADFTTYHSRIVRELIAQGYIVVAPEYRGSTGYGRGIYRAIDYGGREVGDCLAARDWVVANHPRVDEDRVGLIGWSHGGLITLHSLFDHPDKYVVGFAGVPVSDLIQRMGYLGPGYQAYYEADYHIDATPRQNLEEYKRRSPVWNVEKLTRPVRIHGNVHDEDVNVIEVEHLIQALTAAGKEFEYEIYDLPGGHSFDRLDVPEAWEVRRVVYDFLARYLEPPQPNIELGVQATGRASP